MSHDRCCFKCWKEPWEWINCSDKNCVKKRKEIFLQNKGEIKMTPLHLKILLHYHCTYKVQYAFYDKYHAATSEVVKNYTKELVDEGFIERCDDFYYQTTDKGKFYVEALCSLPFPVKKTIWEIPK